MKPSPMRLYDFPFSGNGYKVRLALAHLGMPVEYEVVDLLAGKTGSKQFLAKNPMGQIPVLELEDGTLLRESNSILYWLADGTDLMSDDLATRTGIVQWFCFEQSNIDKVLGRTRFLKRYPHFMATSASDWEQWYSTGYRALAVLEGALSDREYLVGDSYSVADICVYGYVHCAEEGGFDLTAYPSVDRWRKRIQGQSGYHPIDEVHSPFSLVAIVSRHIETICLRTRHMQPTPKGATGIALAISAPLYGAADTRRLNARCRWYNQLTRL